MCCGQHLYLFSLKTPLLSKSMFPLQADINSREYLRVNFKPLDPSDRGE